MPMYDIILTETARTDYSAAHFLQTRFWAEFKAVHGWEFRAYDVTVNGQGSCSMIVLLKAIRPFGLFAYIPMGPCFLTEDDSLAPDTAEKRGYFLTELAVQLRTMLPDTVFFLRFDPPWGTSSENTGQQSENLFPLFPIVPARAPLRFIRSPYNVQPPDTVVLNLHYSEEELLNGCKQKWRYNIRLAQRKGVRVDCFSGSAAEKGVPVFYRLYRETAVRDGIAIHSYEYYERLCKDAAAKQWKSGITVSVYIASHENEALAAIITLFSRSEAVYLYGASSNQKRNLMPAYLLQWQALCDAKAYGCSSYDLYGIPPCDDPAHPMYGLYRFKTGFGGCIIHRIGSIDVPYRSFRYKAYVFAEQLRSFWFKTVKKRLNRLYRS